MKNTDKSKLLYAEGNETMVNMDMLEIIDKKMNLFTGYVLSNIPANNPTLDYFCPEKVLEEHFEDSLDAYKSILEDLLSKGILERDGENIKIIESALIELTTENI